ncbi:hypothetical protein Tsubulata_005435, partial [Turnera subulata]
EKREREREKKRERKHHKRQIKRSRCRGERRGKEEEKSICSFLFHLFFVLSFSLFPVFSISPFSTMTTSRRLADRKNERFEKNITRRGSVPETTTKKGKDYPVGPIVLGFFIFVVIGSSLFQIIRTATSGGMA